MALIQERLCSYSIRIRSSVALLIIGMMLTKELKIYVHLKTNEDYKIITSPIETKLCKPHSQLPKEWCMDEDGTPRYTGTRGVSYDNQTSIKVKRYNHKGFEQVRTMPCKQDNCIHRRLKSAISVHESRWFSS